MILILHEFEDIFRHIYIWSTGSSFHLCNKKVTFCINMIISRGIDCLVSGEVVLDRWVEGAWNKSSFDIVNYIYYHRQTASFSSCLSCFLQLFQFIIEIVSILEEVFYVSVVLCELAYLSYSVSASLSIGVSTFTFFWLNFIFFHF